MLIVAAAFAIAALSGAACGESSTPDSADAALDGGARDGATTAETSSEAGCTLPGSFGSPKCNECIRESCCAEVEACSADPTCSSLMACMLACLDTPDAGACAQGCFSKYADDAGRWSAVDRCANFSSPCDFHCQPGL